MRVLATHKENPQNHSNPKLCRGVHSGFCQSNLWGFAEVKGFLEHQPTIYHVIFEFEPTDKAIYIYIYNRLNKKSLTQHIESMNTHIEHNKRILELCERETRTCRRVMCGGNGASGQSSLLLNFG